MNNLLADIALGKDSNRQFKANVKNSDSLEFVMRNLHKVQAGRRYFLPIKYGSLSATGLKQFAEWQMVIV